MIGEAVAPGRDDVAALRAEMQDFRGEMREEIAALRGELREGLQEMRTEIQALRAEMYALQLRFAGFTVAVAAVAVAIVKLT